MAIPWDWLRCPTTIEEVEEYLADYGAPECWLRQWRTILVQMAPGDELWEYSWDERATTVIEPADRILGFQQILDGELLERLGLLEYEDCLVRDHEGFALVRGEEILDWIGSPYYLS